jgi:hypothetical protein
MHQKGNLTKAKKQRVKKASNKNEEPSDLISSLVSLASSKEPVAPPASPENTLKAEEPGSPVKQKRKYSRKPKVASVTEELAAAAGQDSE